ncbi:MAG: hypothetical protein LW809_00050 [Vampirovibrionales bacterium]|jgi:hypothetical protein|nr:hypothetical protein [Vampirovibrionales bacterium]
MPISDIPSKVLPKTYHLKKKSKLSSYCIPVTEKIAVSLERKRSSKLKAKAKVKVLLTKLQAILLLKIAYKKALKEYARFIDDRYQGEKAQDRIAKIVEARYQLKRYKEDVSPEEFSPKAIIERWFSFLV